MKTTRLVLGLLLGLAGTSQADVDLVVDLNYTKYEGVKEEGGISHWLGIRYAAPPIGELRFRAPRPPTSNQTLQKADTVMFSNSVTSNTSANVFKHGPVCYSSPSTSLDPALNEDCLFLDVYAPTNPSSALPVFVWFPGGGFNSLSDPDTSGSPLIKAGDFGFVVVTINYRVGPWGFLASREVKENGHLNAGLLDQRRALHWVQEHIHLFGGDPSHVTIGGASAGAASVDLHLSAYGGRDDGLFHAAAAESQSFGAQLTVEESQYQYDALVKRVGCGGATDSLSCLRNVDIRTLTENNPNIPTPGSAGGTPNFMWSNVIDGNFTQDYTYKLFAEGKFVKVPVIFGDDTNEGTIFTPKNISDYTAMNNFLLNNFVHLNSTHLSKIDSLYPQADHFPDAGPYWRTAANAYGEMRYNCPGIKLSATYDQVGMPSYNYHWDYLTSENRETGLGVPHTAELGSIWQQSDHPLSAIIASYWASFIRSKDPNTYKLGSAPTWETFGAGMQRVHFPNDNSPVAMESVPDDQKERCAYLSSIAVDISQ
ncbi:Lipase [Lachnellula subtilissima]|uniref:Carboxylic ester hydrolase n=1 Tax=Lachnellula subtilissima TaxID=602034 RepID=A0A8H8UAF8_9HELO|nr:Lipase [Lachnellula subtilissima]